MSGHASRDQYTHSKHYALDIVIVVDPSALEYSQKESRQRERGRLSVSDWDWEGRGRLAKIWEEIRASSGGTRLKSSQPHQTVQVQRQDSHMS
ncbi:thiamine pyrophosphate enzyme [Aspergillus luchuensis]|uniref:Thiamine pyrophosphate enzyme n=1 Tax=Aspergillus kawachii TaxID=1069201 RepID=A0A146F6X5_ASPKA|nr:thiamine pyrophosphate enzyme [Aspergillus luchuensis]